jgi:hypothetical protein
MKELERISIKRNTNAGAGLVPAQSVREDANQFGLNSILNLIKRLFAVAHWAGTRPAPTISMRISFR